jgi:hypothetical protein
MVRIAKVLLAETPARLVEGRCASSIRVGRWWGGLFCEDRRGTGGRNGKPA